MLLLLKFLLADEPERGLVLAQVFPNDIAEAVVTAPALKLCFVRALGVHIGKQHAETPKHVLEVLDSLHVVHGPAPCRKPAP